MVTRTPLSPCAEQVRRNDPDRFLTALFAPAAVREDLFALYALNDELARAREAASEALIGVMRLQWWRDAIEAIHAGTPPRHPVARAVSAGAPRRAWPKDAILALIDARERDFADGPPENLRALEDHVAATAGALALLALATLGIVDTSARQAARHAGIAFGLAGLMRSIPDHARARRVLLPANVMAQEGLAAEDIGRERRPRELAKVVASVCEVAEAHLLAARRLRNAVPRAAVPALLVGSLAGADLAALRRAGYDPFDPALARGAFGRRLTVTWRAAVGRY
ncbi:MAG: squalene/phytoene synthase family protein [Alphaproteobacteria bacterium]